MHLRPALAVPRSRPSTPGRALTDVPGCRRGAAATMGTGGDDAVPADWAGGAPDARAVAPGRHPVVSGAVGRPHTPMRPLWRCRRCGCPWPCPPARLALLAEYRDARSSLAVYLALALADALDDLHRLSLDNRGVHARFLGWLRTAPPGEGGDLPSRGLRR